MRLSRPVFISIMTSVVMLGASGLSAECRQPPASASEIVDHYISDAALRRSWAVMIDCRHPSWPARAIEIPYSGTAAGLAASAEPAKALKSAAAAVRSGSWVEVWSEGEVQIHLSGVALESAALGQPVEVRAGMGSNRLRGIVCGPHSVELATDDRTGWCKP